MINQVYKNLKNDMSMKLIFIGLFSLLLSCRSSDPRLDIFDGEFILNKYYYKKNCLSCDDFYLMYLDKTGNWLSIDNLVNNTSVSGKYKLYYSNNNEIFLDVYRSSDKKIIGEYLVEIDTLFSSNQRDELRIVIQSKEVYIETYKNIIKKIGG
jgi:hypothetical protein